MAEFLLVHCGFAGGWTWNAVAEALRTNGHRVFAPTLTGLGERAHLANPSVDLSTHIHDLLGVAACEELSGPIVVASSSGAMAATGFAQASNARVSRLVYIDTLVPRSGESWMDLLGPSVSAPLLDAAKRFGAGWQVPRTDVQPPRWVAQPLASVTQPLPVGRSVEELAPVSYVYCTSKPKGWFFGLDAVISEQASRARLLGWDYHELDSDHLPMLSAPQALADLLHGLALRADA